MSIPAVDLSSKTIGFLGCGKISSCMVRGYATARGTQRPRAILVSKRTEGKSLALAAEFPECVEVCEDNADLVNRSDVVFLGLLPPVAKELLPGMPFGGASSSKLIISMLAAMDIDELRALCSGVPNSQIVRTVPLPSVARHQGPILVHPCHMNCISVLDIVGTPVLCEKEEEMKPLVCLTGMCTATFMCLPTASRQHASLLLFTYSFIIFTHN